MPDDIRNLLYLLAAVLFILGIKGLTHPRSAVRGNLLGGLGMLLAIIVTLLDQEIVHWWVIIAGILIGTVIGIVLAARIAMTAMPQLVALFNGFGGLASFLVAGAELQSQLAVEAPDDVSLSMTLLISTAAAGIIGAVTFTGSIIALLKLQGIDRIERLFENIPHQQFLNAALVIAALGLSVLFVSEGGSGWLYMLIVLLALALGVFSVTPIGGADMPVVIALLNSYSGLAAAATGFVLGNTVLIIAGSLVGASGLILTRIMCQAMNRSLTNVIFGVMAEGADDHNADELYAGKVKSTTPEEAAMLFETARRVCIVPGYGMAVAQAQHAVSDLMHILERNGTKVEFGIHPVAGRMPGHMNVLLAEADVPYDALLEMDAINNEMQQVDIALVIGANDVVNPDARTNPASPIAGMPIINVDQAKTAIVIKRSLSPGFAGIPNPLFAADNCLMMFGDGKKVMLDLVTALKEG